MLAFLLLLLGSIETGRAEKEPVLDDNGNVITEEEIKADRYILSKDMGTGCIAGCIGGGALGFAGLMGGMIIGAEEGCYELGCGMGEGLIGLTIGHTLGSAIGVYLVGNIGNETGSFLATLGGSILGGGLGLTFVFLSGELLPFPLLVCPPIGATIGFNLTRRYKSPPTSETALINVRDSQISLVVPTPYSQPDCFDGITQRVDLVNMSF
jgi:hypothetical protein